MSKSGYSPLYVETQEEYSAERIQTHLKILKMNKEFLENHVIPNYLVLTVPEYRIPTLRILSKLNKWIAVIRMAPRKYYLCPNELLCDFEDSDFIRRFLRKERKWYVSEIAMSHKYCVQTKNTGTTEEIG